MQHHFHFHLHHHAPRRVRYDVDMTQGSTTRHLINFALPLLAGNLFQQLYNMVDTWVVGNFVSNEAFSAVGTVGPIINMLIGFFLGMSSGAGVVISQYYGAHRPEKVHEAVHTAMLLTVVMGVVFTGAGIAMTPLMLRLMKTPAEVAPDQTAYLTIYFAGIMGLLLYNMGSGILRAVGAPHQRFTEDALRILRLYRFAARFGFAIDPATGQAARALCRHLDCVSEERIAEELSRLLAAPAPGAYLEAEVLAVIFPELDAAELPESRRILDALEPGMEHVPVRLAALLCPLGEAGAREALKRLKCSNALTGTVATLVGESRELLPQTRIGPFHCPPHCLRQQGPTHRTVFGRTSDSPLEETRIQTKRLLGKYGLHMVEQLDALCGAIAPDRVAEFAVQAELARQLEADGACCRINQLAVNGRDLMDAGIRPGPGLRRVLDALLEQVLTEQLPNEKAALLDAAAQVAAS